jgi:hypothetical protein
MSVWILFNNLIFGFLASQHDWFLGEVYKNSFATETKGGVF